MKAYLVKSSAHVPPFQKPASQLRFRGHTVESRLEEQLREDGFEVVRRAAQDVSPMEANSISVSDDVFVSRSFFRRLVRSIPNRRRNYRCHIESSKLGLFSRAAAPEAFRELPISYCGTTEDSTFEPLQRTAPVLVEIKPGVPTRMHTMTDLRVYLLDDFAVRIEHWFDLLTASGLYCREFGANILRPAAAILPASLVTRLSEWSWLMERVNTVGKNCRIHRSAVLEGCVLGDGVEIGPFAYLRGAVIGDGALIGAHSSVRMSYVGDGAYIMGSDVLNSYVGSETSIVSPMLYNVVFGERGFLSGGSGFADFIVGAASIVATIDGREVPTNQTFLGSAVGDDCFLGVNLVFAPGRTIPGGTRLLDNGLVKHVPAEGGTYVLSGTTLLRVPDGFVGKGRA